jgi:hypothetical protein
MDSKRIEELLNRYWKCETSLQEEQLLREYFNGDHVDDTLKENIPLFKFFQHQRNESVEDVGFDDKVVSKIETPIKTRSVSWLYNAVRIAAGVLVLVTAMWFVRSEIRKSTPQEVVDTYDDPHLALEETKKALLMISKSFGTAEEQVKKINVFNEAQEAVEGNEEAGQKL